MKTQQRSIWSELLFVASFKQRLDIFEWHRGGHRIGRRKNVSVAVGFAQHIDGMPNRIFNLLRRVVLQALVVDAATESDFAAELPSDFVEVHGLGLDGIKDVHAEINQFGNQA